MVFERRGTKKLARVATERRRISGYMKATAYTGRGCPFAKNSQTSGGQSWTRDWLKFDNAYFAEIGCLLEGVAWGGQ